MYMAGYQESVRIQQRFHPSETNRTLLQIPNKQGASHHRKHIVDSSSVRAISFPYWWYPSIKKKLGRSIDLLTWKHRTTQFIFLLSHEGKKMLDDKQLKVILVKDKGKHHR